MSDRHHDHYVPRFVLERFRPSRLAKLFYAEKGAARIGRRSPRRVFRELGGELLLKEAPAIEERDGVAVLAAPPVRTGGLRTRLMQLESRWAHAIANLVRTVHEQHDAVTGRGNVMAVTRAPPGHGAWAALGKDYCMRQMYRSPDAANELWSRLLDAEERELRAWIAATLGCDLIPSDEVRTLWREHNRHKIRTGAEPDAEGLWDDVDSALILATWFVEGDARFVLGSRGGVWVPRDEGSAVDLPSPPSCRARGRRASRECDGPLACPPGPGTISPRVMCFHVTGSRYVDVNRATWEQCRAVVAARRHDIAELL